MSATAIEWATHSWNPFTGCDIVSTGCKHCYAKTMAKRLRAMGNPRYQNDGEEPTSGPGFKFTVHWDKLEDPQRFPAGARVFVNSMSDVFHEKATPKAIAALWAAMSMQPDVTFLILTKRPQYMRPVLCNFRFWLEVNARRMERGVPVLPGGMSEYAAGEDRLPNVWLGVSIENKGTIDRADILREAPAAVRFISAEPLLMDLAGVVNRQRGYKQPYWTVPPLRLDGIDWLIAGGESGPGARPCDLDWLRWLRDECVHTGTAFFLKQLGGHPDKRGGEKAVLDGGTYHEFPDALRAEAVAA